MHDDTVASTKTLQVATWTADMAPEEDRERERLHKGDGRAWQRRRPPRNSDGTVLLRGEWYYTPVAAGNLIHICSLEGRYRTDILPLVLQTRCCTTLQHDDDDDDLVLIVHPDLLLTPTTISETVSCTRRAILKNRLGSTGLTGKLQLCILCDVCIRLKMAFVSLLLLP